MRLSCSTAPRVARRGPASEGSLWPREGAAPPTASSMRVYRLFSILLQIFLAGFGKNSQSDDVKTKTYPEFTFHGWIELPSAKAANKARRELRSIHSDICSHVGASTLEPKRVTFNASDANGVKRIARLFPDASCGWRTTAEEKIAVRELDIAAGVDFGCAGKLTQANKGYFVAVKCRRGQTFTYSESFDWGEVEQIAAEAGWRIEERPNRTAQIVGTL